MKRKSPDETSSPLAKRRIVIERFYQASLGDVWDLWTTKAGIEAWWGPGGFSVEVRTLELRPGGELRYAMTAVAAEQIDFMKRAGLPLTTEARVIYDEVVPKERLAYTHLADFIPGIKPYRVATLVELHLDNRGVRMVITLDPMHDHEWTERALKGMESQLEKIGLVTVAIKPNAVVND